MLLAVHSFGRWCYLHNIPVVPRLTKAFIYVVFNCLLPPQCSIGRGTRLHHHGWCIGLHENVELGEDCNIYNQVEIGGGHDGPDGPPIRIIIGDRVNVSTGAKICCKSGTLTIGDGSTIGANSVVMSDVPPNSLAIGIPARCVPKRDFAQSRKMAAASAPVVSAQKSPATIHVI